VFIIQTTPNTTTRKKKYHHHQKKETGKIYIPFSLITGMSSSSSSSSESRSIVEEGKKEVKETNTPQKKCFDHSY